jgi:class 3 adenylate cyclase
MPSERIQRRIDALLDEADAALGANDWAAVQTRCEAVLRLDPNNADARSYLEAATSEPVSPSAPVESPPPLPTSFAAGRYTVHGFLGEGGSKKVYLAHDTRLDRDVALAVVEGLDSGSLERVRREARAVARLGDHPNIVAVYDTAEDHGQLLTVYQYMPGGSLADLAAKGPVPFERIVALGAQVCDALAFAHGKGIIHRDLKPANVLLAESGDARLGDFGLAAALDRTRLTEQGTFLGTAAYVAPEQAMGQPADARSDLYSLGCVLYELVTGRPPFVGDDTVAVVTQQLNTPPVAPSWHRAEIPPGLEALVLRLLEKDPGKRPQSATEAGQALRHIDLAQTIPQSAAVAPQSSDPLYRTVFVGREAELRQLQAAFDTALSGNGGLVMVVGEPGIGKTALTGQLATYVAMRGGRALHGNCYEEGSLSLPYLPFVEAMRSYVLDHDPDSLRSELGSNAPYVAKIVSEVREKVSVELPTGGDPEDDRWRLLQGVTTFLKNAAAVQPLMLLLEDLHWSDRGTLDLLNHLCRNLEGARLLVVGTYRDVDVDRSHPLSAALAELRRSTNFSRVTLRGLGVDDVTKMLSAIAGLVVSRTLADQVHRQTEGNPLFVQEMARWLVEEGHLREQSADSTLGTQIPEGLRDVIGKRLSRLSRETNRLLAIAAVIGRDFDLATVRAIARMDEETLLTDLEEGVHVGVLEERSHVGGVHYRFAHAFFRQALYEELGAARRLGLHEQAGRALEQQYGQRVTEHATELAEHFSYSTDPVNLDKAVEYAQRAATRASAVYDHGEAARLLGRALAIQEVLDPDDRARRCDLQLGLAWAKQREGDEAAAREIAFGVADLARKAGLVDRLAQAAQLVGVQSFLLGEVDEPLGSLLREVLEILPPGDSASRAYVMSRLGVYLANTTDVCEATGLTPAAIEMARRVGDPLTLSLVLRACSAALFHLPPHGSVEETNRAALALADELERVSPAGVVEAEDTIARLRLGVALSCGEMPAADRLIADWEAAARRHKTTTSEGRARYSRLSHLFATGELPAALEISRQNAVVPWTTAWGSGPLNRPIGLVRLLSAAGQPQEAEQLAQRLGQEGTFFGLFQTWLLVRHGDRSGARHLYDSRPEQFSSALARSAGFWAPYLADVVASLGDLAAAKDMYSGLLRYSGFNLAAQGTAAPASWGPADRYLGVLAATIGQFDVADRHFLAAIEQCELQGTPTFLAESRYNYADMLLRRDGPGDRAQARRLLARAIEGARTIGYVWLVEHALALQMESQGLGGSDPFTSIVAVTRLAQAERPDLSVNAAPDGTLTIMFTDIENSTALTEQVGDANWVDLLREHNAVVEREVQAHGGKVVKNRGDGYMLIFAGPERGLDCAVAIQQALAGHEVIRVRIGLHIGDPVREGEDFFGTDVNFAARVADRALGGQVLVSARLYDLLNGEHPARFGEPLEVEFKGFAGKHRVYAVAGA